MSFIKDNFQIKSEVPMTEKVYERRLECYPEAFYIINSFDEESFLNSENRSQYLQNIKQSLTLWYNKYGSFLLSKNTLHAFSDMIKSLDFLPDESVIRPNKEEVSLFCKAVSDAITVFGENLRKDLGLF